MSEVHKPDLVLTVPGREDKTLTLDPPQGRDSFRIVACSYRTQSLSMPTPEPSFSHFGAIVHTVVTMLLVWWTRHP